MKTLSLLVIGDTKTCSIYSLLGAETLNLVDLTAMEVVEHLEFNRERIGAVLLLSSYYQEENMIVQKLNKLDIPWIVLPADQRQSEQGYLELQGLAEKAIGMKLKLN